MFLSEKPKAIIALLQNAATGRYSSESVCELQK